MKTKVRLPAHLFSLPAAAVAMVLLLAGLTLADLASSLWKSEAAGEAPGPGPLLPEPEESFALEGDVTDEAPRYTEEEALRLLDGSPSRAVVEGLWSSCDHRERLHALLLESRTPPDVRLDLLERFRREEKGRALEGARAICDEEGTLDPTLLLSAYWVLAREGEAEDLARLEKREGGSHQLRTLRERCLARLRERLTEEAP